MSGTRLSASALCSLLLAFGSPPPALAQPAGSAVTGTVRDPAGQPVAGATVTAVNAATHIARRAITDSTGLYSLPSLPPGAYDVSVSVDGFRTLERQGIRLTTGATVRVDLELALGGVSETVTVAADTPLLRSETGSLGQIITHEKVVGLPLNGRGFMSLAALAPGVAVPPGSALPRINGGRPRTNEYLFDGISVLQPEPGQIAFAPVADAIEELKVETNSPSAEFGRFSGGVINLTTRSGTNAVRATLFEFFRHESLNARNVFAPAASGAAPRFRRHQFGGVVGGPVRRERTFFFADYQGHRQSIARTAISTVPTLLQRQGIFTEPIAGRVPLIYDPGTTMIENGLAVRAPFPANTIPIGRMDPVALALLNRYPLPTATGTANNFTRVADEAVDQDQFAIRFDHNLRTGRDNAFVRVGRFRERFLPVAPLPDGSGQTAGTPGLQHTQAALFASSYRRTLSERVYTELRVGDTRRGVVRVAVQLAGSPLDDLGLPNIPSDRRFRTTLPTFAISGYQQIGSSPNTATDFATSVTQVTDTVTWVKGRHALKFGADLRWVRLNVVQPPSPAGSFQFSSLFTDLPGAPNTGTPLASFLLGQVQSFSIDLQQDQIRNRAHIHEYFVQDDWRISDTLTANAGVRYTLNFPSYEERNQAAVFNLTRRELEYLGRDGNPRSARVLQKLNFGPRLGIVARASDKTIASAAYGLAWIEQSGISTPFTTPAFPFLQTLSQRTLDNVTPAFVLSNGPRVAPIPFTAQAGIGQGVFGVDRTLGSGYVHQWNASLQHRLTANMAVDVGYVGSRMSRAGVPDANLNQLTVEQLARGSPLLSRVPNPYFGIIPRSSSLGDETMPIAQLLKPYPAYTTVSLYRNNIGTTLYQGLTARLERRFSRGVSFLVSYTRSKLVDDASSVFDASILTGPIVNYAVADSFNRRLDRDYSTGDIPHVLVGSFLWEIADRWTISGVVTLQSGMPVAVAQATNFNAFAGFGTQRPNRIANPELPSSQRTTTQWFNTAAFSQAPPFTLGNSSRNPVRGPGYRNVDLALVRVVPLAGAHALEIRLEVFNATNTPVLGAPNGLLGSAGFGSITTAGDPRVVQMAVKVRF